jgi:hypothetical protein
MIQYLLKKHKHLTDKIEVGMDITPQNEQQPISDDQELAKALAGVLPDVPESTLPTTSSEPALQFQVTPVAPAPIASADDAAVASAVADLPQPVESPEPTVSVTPSLPSSASSDLDGIKNDALQELRPLIDRVDLPAEEKFDTYLMLIRSTDDSTLIAPAFASAQNISDETRRAEALLDIIKEIDYLSRGGQQQTA